MDLDYILHSKGFKALCIACWEDLMMLCPVPPAIHCDNIATWSTILSIEIMFEV